ncbi:MAG: gamma-glutamyl-gamma-aminobutyrate hydrolase family protein [Planctomycetota bacterium]
MKKPVIGINANLTEDKKYIRLYHNYCTAILKAGGIPFVIPSLKLSGSTQPLHARTGLLEEIIGKIDGLLLSGGDDLSPTCYDEKPLRGKIKLIPDTKQIFDLQLTKSALKKKIPILGVCYGTQLLNVALGGDLFQDIPSQMKTAKIHTDTFHKIYICEGTLLYRIIGQKTIRVNSLHHQAIKTPGENLMVNSRAEDCIIEGIEIPYHLKKNYSYNKFCLGVQWHPERLLDRKEQFHLFRAFVQAAS